MLTNVSNALGFVYTLVTAQVITSGQDLNCFPSVQPGEPFISGFFIPDLWCPEQASLTALRGHVGPCSALLHL